MAMSEAMRLAMVNLKDGEIPTMEDCQELREALQKNTKRPSLDELPRFLSNSDFPRRQTQSSTKDG